MKRKKSYFLLVALLILCFVSCSNPNDGKNKIILEARTTVSEIKSESEKQSDEKDSDSEITETEKEVANSTEAVIVQTEESVNETTANGSIQQLEKSDKVKNGSEATLKIKGKPNTEYSIKVMYSSGASKASGLENKVSDENGCVSWTWKVGAKTTEGEHEITVTGGGESIKTTFTTYK